MNFFSVLMVSGIFYLLDVNLVDEREDNVPGPNHGAFLRGRCSLTGVAPDSRVQPAWQLKGARAAERRAFKNDAGCAR